MSALKDIQAEIDASRAIVARESERLALLERKKAEARAARDAGILADFDAGMSRADIVAKWDMEYGQVTTVLFKHGRSNRRRKDTLASSARASLHLAQQAHYDRLRRQGTSPAIAMTIAKAVAP